MSARTEERYEAFKRANPWFLSEAIELARMKRQQTDRWSVKALVEIVRWERFRRFGVDGSGFKINNSVTPLLAREIMELAPELEGFFQLRERGAA